MKADARRDLKKKPISKLKFVRDTIDLGSPHKAVKKQKPKLAPAQVSRVVRELNQDEVVIKLRQAMTDQVMGLNDKRISRLHELLDSDSEKIALGAVAEAGKVVEQFRDRSEGKAKQQVEVHSSHVNISLDFSGKSAVNLSGDGFDDLIEGEAVDYIEAPDGL